MTMELFGKVMAVEVVEGLRMAMRDRRWERRKESVRGGRWFDNPVGMVSRWFHQMIL